MDKSLGVVWCTGIELIKLNNTLTYYVLQISPRRVRLIKSTFDSIPIPIQDRPPNELRTYYLGPQIRPLSILLTHLIYLPEFSESLNHRNIISIHDKNIEQ